MPRAVILTALPLEYLAVRNHLTNLQEETHPQGNVYERGEFSANGQVWEVGIVEVGAGNVVTSAEAERAIAHFNPSVVLFVGIAGGIKDVAIGDVVAATKVYGYESGKAKQVFEPRPNVGVVGFNLEQRARAEAKKEDWLKRLSAPLSEPTLKVFVAPIAAGEKVIASKRTEIFKFLRANYGDAIAVEMEGIGLLTATRANQQVSAMVIRGISDLLDKKNQGNETERQKMAARHASAFAFEIISKLQGYPDAHAVQELKNPIQIDPSETIQTKRAQLRKNENDLRLLQEQEFNYGTSPRSPQEEIHFKEQYISALRQSIREDLNRLSPLPLRRYGRFIGRRQNIDRIINTLNDFETHPIIAIDGLGGVGKTALAREVAQRSLESEVFAAIVWESAKPKEFTGTDLQVQFTAAVDFDNLLDLIGRKLGYFEVASQKSTEDKRKLVSRILNESSERYLVVVDNLETVKGYRDLVNNLNGMFTRSKAILTTRKKITEFRHVYSLSLRGMERNESVEFLRSLASEKGESGDIILFAEEQKLIKVHEATGGLPLAMELVVGQATRSSLDRVLNLLQSVNFQAVENPESAEDVYSKFFKFIYWDSWSQLSDEARELLISLGTFDLIEGADIDELTIVSGLPTGVIDNASGELMEHSLIHRAIKDEQMSLFLHPLTHRFVQDDLVRA
jgi:nucleoside phosphorylase/AAA+ ATPase superfamily predicted ATPase